ncbi:MAG: hypothetical protein EOO43_17925 [Flavobacterium sp.]|nr:MAG: hypothetical protein EOO43_17925 [Flavobacterium sp.]
MVNYGNAKIYKIVDKSGREINVYIDATCIDLPQRLAQHVYSYKLYLNGKQRYTSCFDIIKHGKYEIELIEEFNTCTNEEELKERKRHYINAYGEYCLNKQATTNTEKQELKSDYAKKHREKYKDFFKDYSKKYYENNKKKQTCEICGKLCYVLKSHQQSQYCQMVAKLQAK